MFLEIVSILLFISLISMLFCEDSLIQSELTVYGIINTKPYLTREFIISDSFKNFLKCN